MKPTARSHLVVVLTAASVVASAWACGSSELDLPDGGDAEPPQDAPVIYDGGHIGYYTDGGSPDSGLYDGVVGYDGYDNEGGFDGYPYDSYPVDGYYEDGYPYDGNDYDGYLYDGGFAYDGEFFDGNPPAVDAGPPWSGSLTPVTVASGYEPLALAVDNTTVYWQNSGGTVLDCPASGCPGNIPTLLAFNGSEGYFGPISEAIAAGSSSAIYLTSSRALDSCASGGCGNAPTTYFAGPPDEIDGGGFDGGGNVFSELITDSSNVYFTDSFSLYSCPIGSTCASANVLLTVPAGSLNALAVAGGELYYVDDGPYTQSIRAIPIGGGKVRVVCESSILSQVNALVVSGGYAYFTANFDSASIYECPAAGSGATPTVFATDVYPDGLAADGTSVYWTNNVSSGSIGTCAIAATCGGSNTVASNQDYPGAIAVNSSAVFWTTETAIYSATK
jgi:hypothetical protein